MRAVSSFLIGGAVFFLCLDVFGTLNALFLPSGLLWEKSHGRKVSPMRPFGAILYHLPSLVARYSRSITRKAGSKTLWDEITCSLAFQIKAGATVIEAIREVSREGTTEGHKALFRVFEMYQAGSGLKPAMDLVSKEFPALSTIGQILDIGVSTGCNLPNLLCHASEIMRRRRLFRGEVKAKLAEAKMTAALLSVLPWFMAFLLRRVDNSAISQLTINSLGRSLIFMSITLWALGIGLVIMLIKSISPKGGDA